MEEDNNARPEDIALINRVLAHPIERWGDLMNAICRIPVAREFMVVSKRDDIPLHAHAMMGHESLHIDNARQRSYKGMNLVINDYESASSPVTWALLFGWVPDCLKEK